MFYKLWIKRVLLSSGRLFQPGARFSLLSLILGVSALTTAVLTVEGFSNGLKRAVQDISGHILILTEEPVATEVFHKILQPYEEKIQNRTDFLSFEGLILKDGAFKGALFEGADFASLQNNPRFLQRLGGLPPPPSESPPFLIVGRALAKELQLSVGSSVVVAAPHQGGGGKIAHGAGARLSRKASFKIAAIADFGRHALNARYVLTSLPAARKLKAPPGAFFKGAVSTSGPIADGRRELPPSASSRVFSKEAFSTGGPIADRRRELPPSASAGALSAAETAEGEASAKDLSKTGGGALSGSRLWLKNPDLAEATAEALRAANPFLSVASWRDMERRFFDVIEMDKQVIFFVLLVLVAAAGFNVSGALFTAVFRRTREISVLKAMGASPRLIAGLFLMEGFFLALMGAIGGIGLGYSVCRALFWFQEKRNFIPAGVYPVNEIPVRLTGSSDIPLVFASALAVSLTASLFPAVQAYRKDVADGLRWS